MTGTHFSSTDVAGATPKVTEDPEVREQDGNDEMAAYITVYAII